jgi:ABC-type microcin C transport system duplicated ATPase subunit YejF
MQIVFQDPYGSLSPRLSVSQIIEEGLLIQKPELDHAERRRHVSDALREVGLDPKAQDRYPHEFSGGQRQRIAIARAFLKDAPILILDEATAALDTESEEAIREALSLLVRGRTVIAIAHRLATLRHFDRVVMLQAGQILEDGPPDVLMRGRGPYRELVTREMGRLALHAA